MQDEVMIDIDNPKDDYISRQAVLKLLKGCLTGGDTEYEYVKIHIDSIPSVKPQEPKTGHWIIHGEPPINVIECSECGQKYHNNYYQPLARFCSMCGAKMEG